MPDRSKQRLKARQRRWKPLAQIAYEHSGGPSNFGSWHTAPNAVRHVHEQIAEAVRKTVLRRERSKRETT
jgi:hypothetical protein